MQVANNICGTPEKFSQGGVKANAQCPCCTLQATTIDRMLDLGASRQYKSRNGAETKKLVEAVERGTLAKLPEEHTVKTLKAMLQAKFLDCKGNKKELMLRLRNSLGKNQIAKIEQLKTECQEARAALAAIEVHPRLMALWGLEELFGQARAHTHTRTHTRAHTCKLRVMKTLRMACACVCVPYTGCV